MDWNALKVFLAISRQGSLSGAAKELGVNHSTVFRRLVSYEEEIGGKLFERINNHYELTALGHELLGLARTIESSFDDVDRYIVGKDIQPKGTVKITAPNNIAYRYLPGFITEFNQTYPEIEIELLVSSHALNMSNRQADIAVRATPSPPEHLIGKQVATLNWSVYGSREYEAQFGLPTWEDELDQHILIGGAGELGRLPPFVRMDKHYASQVVTRCDDLIAMACFVESGRGLAFLPEDQFRPGIVKLFDAPGDHASKLWLLTHSDLRNVTRIKLVMQFLADAFSNAWDN